MDTGCCIPVYSAQVFLRNLDLKWRVFPGLFVILEYRGKMTGLRTEEEWRM